MKLSPHNKHIKKLIELGCGSSSSLIYLAQEFGALFECVGVDISELALLRAQRQTNAWKCIWLQADILSSDFIGGVHDYKAQGDGESRSIDITRDSFSFVFDMQCFHVLRSIPEENAEKRAAAVISGLLRPGGVAMVVTGAVPDTQDKGAEGVECQEDACTTRPQAVSSSISPIAEGGSSDKKPVSGPNLLTREELETPLEAVGLEKIQVELGCRFSPTDHF